MTSIDIFFSCRVILSKQICGTAEAEVVANYFNEWKRVEETTDWGSEMEQT